VYQTAGNNFDQLSFDHNHVIYISAINCVSRAALPTSVLRIHVLRCVTSCVQITTAAVFWMFFHSIATGRILTSLSKTLDGLGKSETPIYHYGTEEYLRFLSILVTVIFNCLCLFCRI